MFLRPSFLKKKRSFLTLAFCSIYLFSPARLAISVLRKLGGVVFVVAEDLVEEKPKLRLTFGKSSHASHLLSTYVFSQIADSFFAFSFPSSSRRHHGAFDRGVTSDGEVKASTSFGRASHPSVARGAYLGYLHLFLASIFSSLSLPTSPPTAYLCVL